MQGLLDRLANWATGRRPRNAALLDLAMTLRSKGQTVEAAAWCTRVLRSDPDNANALLLSAELAAARADRAGACEALSRLETQKPQALGTLERVAAAYCRAGEPGRAVALLRSALRLHPNSAALRCELGDAEAAAGHVEAALAAYDGALATRPGKSRTATQRAILMLRQAWGPPAPASPERGQASPLYGRIMASELGAKGQFGRQLAQYLAVRLCGHIHGLRVEVPDWIGRWLFDLDDPYPGEPLPEQRDTDATKCKMFDESGRALVADHDLSGSFLVHTSIYQPHRPFIQSLFQPGVRARPIADGRCRACVSGAAP